MNAPKMSVIIISVIAEENCTFTVGEQLLQVCDIKVEAGNQSVNFLDDNFTVCLCFLSTVKSSDCSCFSLCQFLFRDMAASPDLSN